MSSYTTHLSYTTQHGVTMRVGESWWEVDVPGFGVLQGAEVDEKLLSWRTALFNLGFELSAEGGLDNARIAYDIAALIYCIDHAIPFTEVPKIEDNHTELEIVASTAMIVANLT